MIQEPKNITFPGHSHQKRKVKCAFRNEEKLVLTIFCSATDKFDLKMDVTSSGLVLSLTQTFCANHCANSQLVTINMVLITTTQQTKFEIVNLMLGKIHTQVNILIRIGFNTLKMLCACLFYNKAYALISIIKSILIL
ncbi:hypothetical protein EGR_03406 [Echinococcus granulosus]|uniref:Uncharacterized protein n=1 Tax=Echinococcus granulosus TaxID=6210 RepID=W6UJY7_ECHGR|nr:hypothetical protein EGR_03406 [Echinococcus granulosus]EUB61860.1 hypothetical protein EGR_03406 [Echinococcus granulosus]